MRQNELADVRGEITRFFFRSEKFAAGVLRDEQGNETKFAGQVFAELGDRVYLHGKWNQDAKFGWQVKVESFSFDQALDAAGLTDFLTKSKAFKGIGPARAAKIARAASSFPGGFEAALDQLDLFATQADVPPEVMTNLRSEWHARADMNRAVVDLATFQISPGQAQKLFARFGAGVSRIIKDDPYWLIGRVPGMAFKTIDAIALKNGVPKAHPSRIEHAILFALSEIRGDGHTWIYEHELAADSERLLLLDTLEDQPKVRAAITKLCDDHRIVRRTLPNGMVACWHPGVFRAEVAVSAVVTARGREESGIFETPLTITSVRELQPQLTDEQAAAVVAALTYRMSIMSGGAGVGKTFTIQTIVDAAKGRDLTCALCAPTGKAAKRLSESCGGAALTIHKLLEPTREERSPNGDAPAFARGDSVCSKENRNRGGFVVSDPIGNADAGYSYEVRFGTQTETLDQDQLRAFNETKKFRFSRNRENPIEEDIVVIDEVSMVDVLLMADLFDAIDWSRTSVVLVGDHNQLPPVGPGAILRDAIASKPCPITMLTHVHRNAGELRERITDVLAGRVAPGVKTGADDTRLHPWYVIDTHGEAETIPARIERMFGERLSNLHLLDPKAEGGSRPIDPVWDCQLLTPMHKGPIGTIELNKLLQRVNQARLGRAVPDPARKGGRAPIMVGDKVIQTRNNYDLEVMNGSIGRVLEANEKGTWLRVDFDGRIVEVEREDLNDVQLAYAMTVHKAQGSEFPITVTVCHKAHKIMLHRGLLYTAVSRARQSSILIGDSWGMRSCAANVRIDQRRTMLAMMHTHQISLETLAPEKLEVEVDAELSSVVESGNYTGE